MFEPCKGSAEHIADAIIIAINFYSKSVCGGTLYIGQILGALSMAQAHFSRKLITCEDKIDPEASHE